MTPLLAVDGASVAAATGLIVAPFSFTLMPGRPFTILGETGSGKSLLAQAIIGLLPEGLSAAGRVTVDGQCLSLAEPHRFRPLWGRAVGILPQEPWLALDPTMVALDQVAEGYRMLAGKTRVPAVQAARRALDRLGASDAAAKLPGELSGGMAQRVAFAAATAGGAGIIIADEPTKGLDVTRRDEVISLLMQEVERGGTVLTITHDLAFARQMGGDLAVMLDGQIIEQGATATLLAQPQHAYTRRLLAAEPCNWREAQRQPSTAAPILVAEGLTKRRGGRLLLSDQSLAIRPGEIVGITGPSGSGKSTFGDLLLGLLPPDAGRVTRQAGIAPRRYQKLYQDPPAAFPQRLAIGQAIGDLVSRHRLDAGRVNRLMERLRLSPSLLSRRPTEISGGELQRFSLLRVLMLDPVFLFADEPTSRLDLITQQETITLLVDLAREQGCAVLIVSHDADLIAKTCDRELQIGRPLGNQNLAGPE